MMIITGLFLFALGTKFSGATPIKTEVNYEGPHKIRIVEDTGNGKIFLPGSLPPSGPNFIHQGSNFYFNPQAGLPAPIVPPIVETIIPAQKDCDTVNIVNKPEVDIIVEENPAVEIAPLIVNEPEIDIIVEEKPAVEIIPLIEEPVEIVPPPEIVVPEIIEVYEPIPKEEIVEVSAFPVAIPLAPEIPSFVTPELPIHVVPQVSIPVLPELEIPPPPVFVEESVKFSEIPPPPVLPPLVIADIPKPVLVEDNKEVILVPAIPELPEYLPQQVFISERPLLPTACVQNIVLERVLPHIMYENTQKLELISFPAARTIPVVVNSPFNFYK